MKNLLSLLLGIALSATLFAQGTTVPADTTITKPDSLKTPSSKWASIDLFHVNKLDAKTATPIFWFNHENGNYFLEGRLNFDWSNTAAVLIGKTFSKSPKFWITPKAGILLSGRNADGYNGISPECNFGGKFGLFKYFTMNQYAIAVDQHPDFLYQFSEVTYLLLKKHLTIGYGFQVYQEQAVGKEVWIDHGPTIIISLGKIYLKPWLTSDPNHKNRKFIVGLGYKI